MRAGRLPAALLALVLGAGCAPAAGEAGPAGAAADASGGAAEAPLALSVEPPVAQLGRPQHMAAAAVLGTAHLVQGVPTRLAVEFRVAEGFHVNANPPSADWLIPTEVTVAGIDGVAIERAVYPPASEGRFPFFDGALRVYTGNVVTGVVLTVAADAPVGEHTLTIRVGYQACDDEACFAPTGVDIRLPVELVAAGSETRTVRSPLLERARFESDSSS